MSQRRDAEDPFDILVRFFPDESLDQILARLLRLWPQDYRELPAAHAASATPPGSAEKIEIMRLRVRARKSPFRQGDAVLCSCSSFFTCLPCRLAK